ncbi:substrate-binding domain-containing protein [Haladaptatus sp. CMSO5]|uniref:substrate-binding domain-containing protein n=1 Tax=Haladaptatus sp. CMSO5 TaxID=3120514 RepID=UPI002FCE3A31
MQRRRFLQAAGAGAVLAFSGCLSNDDSNGGAQTTTSGEGSMGGATGDTELVLATTTSTYDSGLLDELNSAFEDRFGVTIKTLPKGTGASLRTAEDGDADLVLVHARGAEDEFLEQGYGVNRRDVMYNDFVIVGPSDDPAGISGMGSATDALATIASEQATFVSRGDDSGTHKKEQALWEQSPGEPGGTWYQSIGKGMGDTLVQADQSGAYTLADRGTYLSMQADIGLEIMVQGPLKGGPEILKNPYGVIAVNPAKYPDVNYAMAMAYIGFITGPEGQSLIENYTANGEQLFYPNALAEDPNFGEYVPEDYEG